MGKMIIPEFVIEHCNKFKLCKGCTLNCVAPVSDRHFDDWVKAQISKIENYKSAKRT